MNLRELKVEMLRNDFNQNELAIKLSISKSYLNKKINGNCEFTRREIFILKNVLNLSPKRVDEIFFKDKVDESSTL